MTRAAAGLVGLLGLTALLFAWSGLAGADGTPPERPTGLSVTVDPQGALLSWDEPSDSTITGYEILRRDRNNDAPGTFHTIVEDTEVADTQYSDATIAAGGSYVYRVKALNDAGASQRSSFARVDVAADWVLVQPTVPEVEPEVVLEPLLTPVELTPKVSDVVTVRDNEDSLLRSMAQTVDQTLVKNTGQTTDSAAPSLTSTQSRLAQAFTTGSNADGYTLGSIVVEFHTIADASTASDQLQGELWSESSGNPDSRLCTLSDPSSFSSSGEHEFAATNTCPTLTANTTYFIVLRRFSPTADNVFLSKTTSSSEDSGGADGWSIGDSSHSYTTSWRSHSGQSLQIEVKGAPVPAPPDGATVVSSTGLTAGSSPVYTNGTGSTDYAIRAQPFTTGSNANGYVLRSVGLSLGTFGSPPSGDPVTVGFTAKITTVITNPILTTTFAPSTDVCTLTAPETITASAVNRFSAPDAGCKLAASTTYMAVFEITPTSNITVQGHMATSAVTDSDTGWKLLLGVGRQQRNAVGWIPDISAAQMMDIKAETPNATGAPLILGAAVVDKSMRAYTDGQIADTDGLTGVSYSYQWVRYDGTTETVISGATDSTYTPVTADVGHTLNVVVSFTDEGGGSESLTSLPSETVLAAYPSGTIWMGDLLVGEFVPFNFTGYFLRDDDDHGRLHPVRISDGTNEGRFGRLLVNRDGSLNLLLQNSNIGLDVVHTWILNLGSDSYRLSDSHNILKLDTGQFTATWFQSGVSLTVGDKIRASITTGTSVDNAHTGLLKRSVSSPSMLVKAHMTASEGVGYGTDYTGSVILGRQVSVIYADPAPDTDDNTNGSFSRIAVKSDGTLVLDLKKTALSSHPQITAADVARFSLWLDGEEFLFPDATATLDSDGETTTFAWSSSGLSWSADDVIVGFVTAENREPTGSPTIVGAPVIGQALTADLSTVTDPNGVPGNRDPAICEPGEKTPPTYQWIRIASDTTESDITGAESVSYVPVLADEGLTLKVKVTYTDCDGFVQTLTSDASSAVQGGLPLILGPAVVGKSMLAHPDLITDSDGLTGATFTYQWVRVNGMTETDISGATSATYTPVTADVGKTLKVEVSYTDDAMNSEMIKSLASEEVVAAYPTGTIWMADLLVGQFLASDVHGFTTKPAAFATGLVHPLTVSDGTNSGTLSRLTASDEPITGDGRVTFQLDSSSFGPDVVHTWVLNIGNTALRLSEMSSLKYIPADSILSGSWFPSPISLAIGEVVRVSVSTAPSVSNVRTSLLKRAEFGFLLMLADHDTEVGVVGMGGAGEFPGSGGQGFSTSVPYLAPAADQDARLTISFDYARLSSDGTFQLVLISGANPLITKADMERYSLWLNEREFRFEDATETFDTTDKKTAFSWTNSGLSWNSGDTVIAFLTVEDRDPTGQPTISGTLVVGSTLTANIADVGDANGLPTSASDFSYQWVRVVGTTETDIGTNSTTYELQSADDGARIKVEVSFTDRDGNDETVVSELTTAVGETGADVTPPPAEEIDPNGLLALEPWRIKFTNITVDSARAQVYVNTSADTTVHIRWRGYFYGYDPAAEVAEDEEPTLGWYWSAWESDTFDVEAGFEGRKEHRLRDLRSATQYEVNASQYPDYVRGLSVGRFGTLTNTNVCSRSSGVVRAIERETGYPCMFLLPSDLVGITQLIVSHSNMRSVKSIDFEGLPNLTKLYLNDNRITEIAANAFSGLSNLTDLNLSGNPLGSIPTNLFNGLGSLQRLWINSAGLTSVSASEFNSLTSLRLLDLSYNRLSSLPSGVFDKLTQLRDILLTSNRLSSMRSDVFARNARLRKVGLSYNQFSTLSVTWFTGKHNLRYIGLAHNQLGNEDLPANLVPMGTLNSVHVDAENGTADQVVFYLQGNTAITASDPPAICGADWRIRCVYR